MKKKTKSVEELERELNMLLVRLDFFGERKLAKEIKILEEEISRLKEENKNA